TNNSFWNTDTSGQGSSAGGEGKTTAEMQEFPVFSEAGWDFKGLGPEGIWNIGNGRNDGYPYLSWEHPGDQGPDYLTPPGITIQSVTDVTVNSATVNAIITNTGNPKAENHGICWNNTGDPSIDDNPTDLGPVVEAGQFTVELTGLEENAFYYVRAYATNSQGTALSEEYTFAANPGPEGSGTEEDPYEIASLADLYWVSVNPSEWNKHYLQTADIDASATSFWNSGEGWMPIGNSNTRFGGSYDGDGYAVDGLYINRPDNDYQGLFGFTQSGSSILNLGVTNTDITGSNHVGGLVGRTEYSSISNSYSSGSVSGINFTGGLVGYSYGSPISESYSSGIVSGSYYAGGLVGIYYYSSISDSYSSGIVSGNDRVGGLVGYSSGAPISNSYSSGSVNGNNYLGGLVGMFYYSEINNSYSSGSVNGSGNIGGLVGYFYDSEINKSYSRGSVSGSWNVGGLVGYNNNIQVYNSFWDTETSGQASSSGGTGKLTSEMNNIATFTDTSTDGLDEAWDFTGNPNDDTGDEDYWSMDIVFNDVYPFFGWQDFVEINYYAGANGGILGETPQYVSEGGEGKPVEAVPVTGYHFTQWSDGSTENPRTERFVFEEISVTASFVISSYTLSYSAGPNGSITGPGHQTLNHGESGETVEAVPDEGYYFVDWSDGSTDNPRTDYDVTDDIDVFANFAIITYDLTYIAGANGSITGPDTQTVNQGEDGDPVTAVPDGGYFFSKWDDGSTENPRTDYNVTEDITVTASFGNITLEYLAGPNGSISGPTPQYVNTGDDGEEVEAVPDEGYHFVDWDDGSTENPRQDVSVAGNISVTANFAINEYTLTYDAGPNGSVDGPSPQNLSHGDDGATVEAVPDAGYLFAKWSDGSKENPRTDVNVSGDINVTAQFGNITLTYLAGANGSISGPTPQIINQGESGEEVEAIPDAGYHFVDWSDGNEDNPRVDASVTDDITVTANFAINSLTLNYSAGANGTIAGPVSQELEYGEDGEEVEAVPDDNYYFVEWSDGSTQNPRTDVNVTGSINVTATFAIVTYRLTYNAGANGRVSGPVDQTVDHGSNGEPVEAVANQGYHFDEWSDGSTDNPRTDTNVTADITVSASFEKSTYTLTYNAGVNGSITGETSQSLDYGDNGDPVEAVPDEGYHFVDWSDGSTQNPRLDKGVTGDINVTANFSVNTYTLRYQAGIHGEISGPKRQTVSYGGDGEEVEAVPDEGYRFVEWSDGSTDNPRKDTLVSKNLVVTASYSFILGITPGEGENSFRVYPNPVTDILYVELPDEADRRFELHHISGTLFMQGYLEDGKIDMTGVKQGIYILSVNNRNIRIIKN
ncbi:MAG: InlB B-repeat-containing protein, partial [Bacteroidales bacterium]